MLILPATSYGGAEVLEGIDAYAKKGRISRHGQIRKDSIPDGIVTFPESGFGTRNRNKGSFIALPV